MSKTIPPSCPEPLTGRKYWRSLDELAETPAFREWVEREFPAGASELNDAVSRRHFMQIMSASFLLAGVGLTGCRRPEEKILPFSKLPPGYVHGVPQYYATAMPVRGSAVPLVVKSHEGRPIKVEGNPEHPLNQPLGGATAKSSGTDLHAQASILNLYDPDRAQRFTFHGQNVAAEKVQDFLAQTARAAAAHQGKGLAVLLERSSSPSRARLLKQLAAQLPAAQWFVYEPVDFEVSRQAATLAFGKPVKPLYRLDQAQRILALDCDFIGGEADSASLIRGFAASRKREAGNEGSRLYVVETLLSLTGANADHRLRLPSSQVFPLTALLFAELIEQTSAGTQNPQAGPFAEALRALAKGLKPEASAWAKACMTDLAANAGRVAVLAGSRQPREVHLLAQAFNFYLGRQGGAVRYVEAPEAEFPDIAALAQALNSGSVETLIVLGGNPVYNAPADLEWTKAQRRAQTVIRLGYYEDESFAGADWHVPQAHFLESWGDARTSDGTVVSVQPLIEPLFGGITELEVLARLGGLPAFKPYDIVRETFKELAPEGVFEERWKRFLYDGFLPDSAAKPVEVEMDWGAAAVAIRQGQVGDAPTPQRLEVVFARDIKVDDGRYTNNGWLQELPDPLTKITWDAVLHFSVQTAKDLGIEVRDENKMNLEVPIVRVSLKGRFIEGPAWIQPGLADGVIGVTLGYGRVAAGRVGNATGYNGYPIRTTEGLQFASGASVILTTQRYPLSCTQNHWYMEGRPLIREANLEEYRRNPRFAQAMNLPEAPLEQPMYPNPLDALMAKATHQWGMSVDLNACVGCAACVMACQSENNIPIVGKDQVNRGREMHWLRVDRYFTGPIADPQVVSQPMMCQQCEAAPCESVCPVNATVHDEEGLNVMAYNRCVGTRYCSNNCPYKVRRFNFFDYNRRSLAQLKGPFITSPLVSTTEGEWTLKRWWKDPDRGIRPQDEWDLLKLARNPDVTVRMRGVMEKCTFCVQRIEQAKIAQKVKAGASGDVEVPDGTIRTACQQACPADAIVFGNIKDPHSAVAQAKASDRTYRVLEFLLTKPRVTYQARVRNPNAAMPDYHPEPLSVDEFKQHGGELLEAEHEHGAGPGALESAVGRDAAAAKKGAH